MCKSGNIIERKMKGWVKHIIIVPLYALSCRPLLQTSAYRWLSAFRWLCDPPPGRETESSQSNHNSFSLLNKLACVWLRFGKISDSKTTSFANICFCKLVLNCGLLCSRLKLRMLSRRRSLPSQPVASRVSETETLWRGLTERWEFFLSCQPWLYPYCK